MNTEKKPLFLCKPSDFRPKTIKVTGVFFPTSWGYLQIPSSCGGPIEIHCPIWTSSRPAPVHSRELTFHECLWRRCPFPPSVPSVKSRGRVSIFSLGFSCIPDLVSCAGVIVCPGIHFYAWATPWGPAHRIQAADEEPGGELLGCRGLCGIARTPLIKFLLHDSVPL